MTMPRFISTAALSEEDRRGLQTLAQPDPNESAAARRARIILLSAEGYNVAEVSKLLGCTGGTVRAWRRRFIKSGVAALRHETLPRRRRR